MPGPAIGAEDDLNVVAAVNIQRRAKLLSSRHVPEENPLTTAAGGEPLSVGTERHRRYDATVTFQRNGLGISPFHMPELDGAVRVTRRQKLGVGTNREAEAGITGQDLQLLQAFEVPEGGTTCAVLVLFSKH